MEILHAKWRKLPYRMKIRVENKMLCLSVQVYDKCQSLSDGGEITLKLFF